MVKTVSYHKNRYVQYKRLNINKSSIYSYITNQGHNLAYTVQLRAKMLRKIEGCKIRLKSFAEYIHDKRLKKINHRNNRKCQQIQTYSVLGMKVGSPENAATSSSSSSDNKLKSIIDNARRLRRPRILFVLQPR